MPASNYLGNKLLDHSLGVAPFAMPTTVYLALFTADPGLDGTGPEVAGNGYARRMIGYGSATGKLSKNSSTVIFPTAATAAWGTITHWGIYDALTGGNLLILGAFSAEAVRAIGQGDALILNPNDLPLTFN